MPGMGGGLMTGLRSIAKSPLLPEYAACLTALLSTLTSLLNLSSSCAREDEKKTSAKVMPQGKVELCRASFGERCTCAVFQRAARRS